MLAGIGGQHLQFMALTPAQHADILCRIKHLYFFEDLIKIVLITEIQWKTLYKSVNINSGFAAGIACFDKGPRAGFTVTARKNLGAITLFGYLINIYSPPACGLYILNALKQRKVYGLTNCWNNNITVNNKL